jgi:hypothetical protein
MSLSDMNSVEEQLRDTSKQLTLILETSPLPCAGLRPMGTT